MRRSQFGAIVFTLTAASIILLAMSLAWAAILLVITEVAIISLVTRSQKAPLKGEVVESSISSKELSDTCAICGRPVRRSVAYCSECASKQT